MNPGSPSEKGAVSAVVLAAGHSRRAGSVNKLLAGIDGVPMLRRVVDEALASGAHPVIVVTGHQAEAVAGILKGCAVRLVFNPRHEEGMGASIAAGIAAVPDEAAGVLVVPGDMPGLCRNDLARLIAALAGPEGICVPVAGGRRGNPVLFGRAHRGALAALGGDRGGRDLVAAHADSVVEVPMEGDGTLIDLDTQEAIAAYGARIGKVTRRLTDDPTTEDKT